MLFPDFLKFFADILIPRWTLNISDYIRLTILGNSIAYKFIALLSLDFLAYNIYPKICK